MTKTFKKIEKEATDKFVDELLAYSNRLFESPADASPSRHRKAQSPLTYRYQPCVARQLRATEINQRGAPIPRSRASFSFPASNSAASPEQLIQDEASDSGISGNPSEEDLASNSEKESNHCATENNSNADESMEENEEELSWANHFNKEIEVSADVFEEEDLPAETPLSGHWETLGKIIVFHQENLHLRQAFTHSAEDVATETNCKLEAPDPVGVFQSTNFINHTAAEEKLNLSESFSTEAHTAIGKRQREYTTEEFLHKIGDSDDFKSMGASHMGVPVELKRAKSGSVRQKTHSFSNGLSMPTQSFESKSSPNKRERKFQEKSLSEGAQKQAAVDTPNATKSEETGDLNLCKLLAKASQLASKYDGECLSLNSHISVVKGCLSLKFKCQQGHVFYKFANELLDTSFGMRKSSAATVASSSDEEASPSREQWCPKCESFYLNCQKTATKSGFKLSGKIYSINLGFKCPEKKHLTKISYNRRLTSCPLVCTLCRKEEIENAKIQMREEEERHSTYLAQ
jgi:hypothetical protein